MSVRALVMTGLGINCEEETAAGFRLAGAQADLVHVNDLFQEQASLHEFDILALPGGFSFGDDLGAGKALANKLLFRRTRSGKSFRAELERFLGDGKLILGICNGFQVLVKMGLVPNTRGVWQQEVTLAPNASGRFEDRWCRCAANPSNPLLGGLGTLDLPVRHGEGRVVFADEGVQEAVVDGGLSAMAYVDDEGKPTLDYPANPNGSQMACAALTDRSGQILGMMPHPEAFLTVYTHPDWPRLVRRGEGPEGHGLAIFRALVRRVRA